MSWGVISDACGPDYQMVREVLEPETWPDFLPEVPKTSVLRDQAKALGLEDRFYKVEQTTRFRPGPNSTGIDMSASTLSGQDCTGVNDGSKMTTLATYLADAWNWGAEMFCECEVRYIEKADDERGGYTVYFQWYGHKRSRFKENMRSDLMWVHANSVFFGAGAVGTTELLLRSKTHGLRMSHKVGQNMSGNGNLWAFGYVKDSLYGSYAARLHVYECRLTRLCNRYNLDRKTHAVGNGSVKTEHPIGTTITSVIDCRRGHADPLDGFVIEDAVIPQGLAGFMQAMMSIVPSHEAHRRTIWSRLQASMAWWTRTLLGPLTGSGPLANVQPLIVMSHDGMY